MKIATNTKVRYVPKWNGNRKLNEDEQITVNISMPTVLESEQLQKINYQMDGTIGFRFDTKEILEKHVGAINNLSLVVDGKETEIETGLQLARAKTPVIMGLVQELARYVTQGEQLSEKQQKN